MKHILKGEDTYNLAPFQFPWAFTMTQHSLENFWIPQEVQMGEDRACHELQLSDNEKHLFKHVFATLTTADLAIAENVTERLYPFVKAAEIKLYMGRQIAEEGIHSVSYQHVIEVLGLDQEDTYTLYQRVPAIADWFEFAQQEYRNPDLIEALMFQYGVFESVFFMTGFAAIYALQRIGKMSGTAQQLQYIQRDEHAHVAFGTKLLNEIFQEQGSKPHPDDVHSLFVRSMEKLDAWADYCVPDILGYNAHMHKGHARFLADRRLRLLGYAPLYHAQETLPWLDAYANIRKEKNFFESRVTEYRNAAALHGTWE